MNPISAAPAVPHPPVLCSWFKGIPSQLRAPLARIPTSHNNLQIIIIPLNYRTCEWSAHN